MSLKHRPEKAGRVRLRIPAPGDDLRYVSLTVLRLLSGERETIAPSPGREQALVVLSGQVEMAGIGVVGERASVFSERPATVLYLPPGDGIEVSARSDAELALAGAPAVESAAFSRRLVRPDAVPVEIRGEGVTERRVHHLLEAPGEAGRILLVEVITPGGNWSSFPPHKHDTEDPPTEAFLEELYYYHIDPPNRWAFQRVYRADGWGEALAPGDGEAVVVPRGYHPVSAPPGATVYYLNVMAGPRRDWHFTVDPDFGDLPRFR